MTGKWSKVSFEGNPALTAGGDVACFIAGTKAYAFGSQSGTWAQVELGVNGMVPHWKSSSNQRRIKSLYFHGYKENMERLGLGR